MAKYRYPKQHKSNYNYKTKRSFGQRIKNFFTIPEEDLKEEPSKKFEKIKLFRLNQGIIFLSILVFMFIINILVGFNINFLYLRQILGFLFIILIPGLLIMLCFKIRTVKFWEYLVYTVGLSIAFIMFAGLAVNWTLPALGITNKPLSLWPILICFNIFLLALWFVALYRNKDLKPFDVTIPKLDAINRIFFIIPLIFPLLSILGAFLLNNHGPNILTMIMIGGIAIYVLFLVIFRKKMNENVWLWALYWMGLSLLLSYSLRSWFIFGWDSFREFYVFNITKNNFLWDILTYKNDYNSCLSLTIFPIILENFTRIQAQYIFKLLFQFIFPFILIVLFLFVRKYVSITVSFFASLFFILPPDFYGLSILYRQEIAFFFFSLMLFILFSKEVNLVIKKILFVIFGASMIVSHYSTAYIALAIFTLTYLFILIYKIYENQKIKRGKLNEDQRLYFYLTGVLVLFLLIFGFLWYSQLTDTSSNLVRVFHNSLDNFNMGINEDSRDRDASISFYLNLFYKYPDNSRVLNSYIQETSDIYKNRDNVIKDVGKYSTHIVSSDILNPPNYNLYRFAYYLERLIKIFFKIMIFLGIILLFYKKEVYTNNKLDAEIKIFFITLGILLFLMLSLPLISFNYDTGRLFQQMLLILSLPAILGTIFLLRLIHISKEFKLIFISLLLITYFLFSSGFIYNLLGGYPSLQLENKGYSYDNSYSNGEELVSAMWLGDNRDSEYKICADRISEKKLMFYLIDVELRRVIPGAISKTDYVYAGYPNINKNVASREYRGIFLNYNFPIKFVSENKNKIYSNGGSEIFK